MPLPGDVVTITVTATYLDMQGNPQSGSVVFAPSTGPFADSTSPAFFEPVMIPATLDDAGHISEVLPCSPQTDFAPSDYTWQVTERITGSAVRTYYVNLPSTLGETVDLTDLAQVEPPSDFEGYLPLAAGSSSPLGGALYLDGSPPIVLPSGTNGDVLTSDADGNITLQAASGGGAVSSVFGRTGAVTATSGDYTVAKVTGAAPLASPTFTGVPAAPTASALTDSTQVATTAYADLAVGVETSRAETAEALKLAKASNLSDLASASTARTSLGLGAAALLATPIPSADLPGPSAWVNAVTQHGASTSNSASANDTAIQAALTAVGTAGGGVVYLPGGTYPAANLTVPSNTTLLGDGPGATVLSVAAGTTGAVIALTTPASVRRTCVRDLMIEGNNVSVTGISLDNTGLSPSTPGQHRLYNVTVQDCGVDSFYYGSALVETFSAFLTSYNAGRYGYNVTTGATDSRWASCTTGPSGSHGWVCTGSNDHYDLCKAYYAGWNGSAFGTGHGWYVVGTSAYPTMGSSWTGCEAQDCAQQGWNFNPNGGSLNNLSMMACVIDSCNAAAGTGGAGSGVATDYVVYSTIAGCTAWNRSGGAGTMTYGISVAGVQTGLVMTGNTWNCATGPFFYSSGYGYLLAEQYIFDLTGVSQYVKVPALVQAPASPQALSNSTAVTVNTAYSLIPLTATGAVTGITMPTAGLQSGQTVTLLNQSAFSITFAAAGTSAVADGVSDVIAALTAVAYIWDASTSLWYPLR